MLNKAKEIIQRVKIILSIKIYNIFYYIYFKKYISFIDYSSNLRAKGLMYNIKYRSVPIIKKLEERDKINSIKLNELAMINKEKRLIAKANSEKLDKLKERISNSKIVFEVTNEEYLILSKMDKFSELQYVIDFKIIK